MNIWFPDIVGGRQTKVPSCFVFQSLFDTFSVSAWHGEHECSGPCSLLQWKSRGQMSCLVCRIASLREVLDASM